MRLVLFGVSNLLGDILDCAEALALEPSLIVMNMPQVVRPRTIPVHDRVKRLEPPPRIIQLDEFQPRQGEQYFLGTTAPQRRRLVDEVTARFGVAFSTLVHPGAHVSRRASLAAGVFVGAGSVIASGARLGAHVFVNRSASIGHDTVLDAYVTVRPGCHIAGHVHVGEGTTIGIGATIIEEVDVGADAYVAAGAVVTEDVAARTLVAGIPAAFKKDLQ